MPASRSPALILWLIFLTLGTIWGSSFFFIKLGLEEGLGPLTLVSFRLLIAASFLGIVLRLMGGRIPRDRRTLGIVAVIAVINIVIPFILITWGELHISSALASILNGLVPLFTIVIAAAVLRDEPITLNRLVGLVVGFMGAVLLMSPQFAASTTGASDGSLALLGEAALVFASISYACAAVFIRSRVSGKPLVDVADGGRRPFVPVEIAFLQTATAAPVTILLALLLERPATGFVPLPPTLPAWMAVGMLGVFGSGVAYLLFFRLIDAWGATRTSTVTYVMPIVGIALGVILLREQLHLAEILGSALVIGGLVLANSRIGARRLVGGRPAPTPVHHR